MNKFKVLIVGGSVAGIGLANMLERYGIEYELLEKHHVIAPQLGASIAMFANGQRIIEQMGCWEALESVSSPINRASTMDAQGRPLMFLPDFGSFLETATGYKLRFMDRKDLIQLLFDNLQDKSRVHPSKEVVGVQLLESEVVLRTKDGDAFSGSIVVGADGVHSRIRSEMWRLAEIEVPGYSSNKDRKAIACTYRCIFGISRSVPSIPEDQSFRTLKEHRMYLYQGGPHGKSYWFAFFKNPEKTYDRNIPRYTSDDEKELGAKYADDILFDGLTFGDLRDRRTKSVLVPLEEFVLKKCFHRRIILVGDSFHKLHPLTGFGGNCALESAACLSDLLKDMLKRESSPNLGSIEKVFFEYQEMRRPRSDLLMRQAHEQQRMESLDTPLLKFIATRVLKRLTQDQILQLMVDQIQPGSYLRHFAPPRRQGIVPVVNEVRIWPLDRPVAAMVVWNTLLVVIATVPSIITLGRVLPMNDSGWKYASHPNKEILLISHQFYSEATAIAINGLYVNEAHRLHFGLSALSSALPFTVASIYFGWDKGATIFCIIHIFLTRRGAFYFPSPRAVDLPAALSLPTSLIITYGIPLIYSALQLSNLGNDNTCLTRVWQIAHLTFPLSTLLCAKWTAKSSSVQRSLSGVHTVYGRRDINYLVQFQALICLISCVPHLLELLVFRLRPQSATSFMIGFRGPSPTLVIVVWCCYTSWDLCRVHAHTASLVLTWFWVFASSLVFGPAATLAGTWIWREKALETSRRRSSPVKKDE